jgi:hypothetical protein
VSTYDEGVGETNVEWLRVVNPANLLGGQCDIQRLDILLEMFNLPSSDNREYIRRFVQNVRNRDWATRPFSSAYARPIIQSERT